MENVKMDRIERYTHTHTHRALGDRKEEEKFLRK